MPRDATEKGVQAPPAPAATPTPAWPERPATQPRCKPLEAPPAPAATPTPQKSDLPAGSDATRGKPARGAIP